MRPSRLAALLAGIALGGCGIPQDRHPIVLPGGILNPALGPTRPAVSAPQPAVQATVFFVRSNRVVPVVRTLTGTGAGVDASLHELLGGPTDADLAAGLRTAISSPTELHLVRIDGAIAVVDLTRAFVDVGGEEQILALAQVVLTTTAVAGITSVRFALEGQPVEVPRSDGTLSAGPLTAADYAVLREPSTPTPPSR